MDDRELSLAVVGVQYPNADGSNRRFEIELCAVGDAIHLHREPGNKFDEHAVSVFSERGVQIGYLSSQRAVWVRPKLADGETYAAVFQGMTESAAYIRIRFGGGTPTLPVQRERSPSWSDDFQPDPEGPEWGA